jgi:hypothetical protein
LLPPYKADRIVAEINNGGDMVEATLQMIDPNVAFMAVHATRGKVAARGRALSPGAPTRSAQAVGDPFCPSIHSLVIAHENVKIAF